MKSLINLPIEVCSLNNRDKLELGNYVYLQVSGRQLMLYRSFECQTPFYYVLDKGIFWWGNCYTSLVKQLQDSDVALSVSIGYLRDYLEYQAPLTTDTLFLPIQFLRVGEIHSLDWKSGELLKCDFVPPMKCTPISAPLFRTELVKQLDELTPASTVFHISSGLDCSLLGLLAAQQYGPGVIQLATCNTRGNGCKQELEVARRLSDEMDAKLNIYDFSDLDVFASGRALIDCLGYPLAHPSNLLEFALDNAIVATGANTIVNGKGPDDCLGGYAAHLPQFANTRKHRQRLTVTQDSQLSELLGPQRGRGALFWQSSDETLSLKQRLYYDARALTDSWNTIHHAIAQKLDCRIISPFMSPTIRNGLFALDDEYRITGIKQKVFLRQTFSDIYPDYLLNLPKSGFRLDLQPYFKDYDAATLLGKISGENRLFEHINRNVLDSMIKQTLSGKYNFGWQLWSLYMSSSAMTQFDI